jgi:hypothetical protein
MFYLAPDLVTKTNVSRHRTRGQSTNDVPVTVETGTGERASRDPGMSATVAVAPIADLAEERSVLS